MPHFVRWLAVLAALSIARPVAAQTLAGESLLGALRQGGYVLVMRHAASPRETPDRQTANADNVSLERQLDEHGRTTATAMGKAFRDFKIPIGDVLTSPTYRAMETVRLAQFPNPRPQPELGDGGQSMQGVSAAQTAWLKDKAAQRPRAANAILVTHMPNMTAAFPQWTSNLNDGEMLVLKADERGAAALIARIKIEEWPTLGRR